MAKQLKSFKNKQVKKDEKKCFIPEILANELDASDKELITINDSVSLGAQTVKLLDQLERAGYTAIVARLRELQVLEGSAALDPMARRLGAIERQIDETLALGHPIDAQELSRLLKLAVDAYQARAKAFLLPYGTVSPRTALNAAPRGNAAVNVAIGIGTGVSPRPKT